MSDVLVWVVLLLKVWILTSNPICKFFDLKQFIFAGTKFVSRHETKEEPAEASVNICYLFLRPSNPVSAMFTAKCHEVYFKGIQAYNISLMIMVTPFHYNVVDLSPVVTFQMTTFNLFQHLVEIFFLCKFDLIAESVVPFGVVKAYGHLEVFKCVLVDKTR